jgi:ribosome biogenesis SPOUT family RNA methylase Rps3
VLRDFPLYEFTTATSTSILCEKGNALDSIRYTSVPQSEFEESQAEIFENTVDQEHKDQAKTIQDLAQDPEQMVWYV